MIAAPDITMHDLPAVAAIVERADNPSQLADLLFLPYQRAWQQEDAKLALWEKSRRIGADYCEAWRIVEERMTGRRIEDLWYSSVDESAAREFIEYAQLFCRAFGAVVEIMEGREAFGPDDLNVFRVTLPEVSDGLRTRTPRITAMTSNPRTFRSKGGDIVLSEFAFHSDPRAMWKAAVPATTWGGRVRIITTHNGDQSRFNEFVQMSLRCARGETKPGDIPFAIHRTTIDDAIEDGLVELINATRGTDYDRKSFRSECRAMCATDDDFAEEYLCAPNSQADSYFPYELLRPCVKSRAATPTAHWSDFLTDIQSRCADCSAIYAGVDVGRTTDRFVVWVIGKFGGAYRTLGVLVWQGRSFPEMQMIGDALLSAEFPGGARVRRLCADATGLGMQMGEHWESQFKGRAEAIQFTARFKDDLIPLTRRHIEERTIELPDDPTTLADITSIRAVVTSANKIRYTADQSEHGHADRATALALALHAAETGASSYRPVKLPPGGGGWL